MDLKAIRLRCPSCDPGEIYVEVPGSTCPKHQSFLVSESAIQGDSLDRNLGRLLSDNYLIFDRIGRGGMGSVYQAVHLNLKRIVALKLINTAGIEPEDLELLKGRFEFEARSLSSVSHRNVLTVYDYGVSEGDCYMVLEYIPGQTLSELLKKQGSLSFQQSIVLTNQLLDALTEVHERGLVHRDIKPSNLMLTEKDGQARLVLIDFGVAKAKNTKTGDFQRDLTRTGMAVGTPRYMAPEVLQGEALGPWSDLYAVGVMLYQMLAGHAPFRGSAADVITAHLRDPVPELPSNLEFPEMDVILRKAMAKEPSQRYSTASHFKQALSWVSQSSMRKNARLETQIFAPGQSSQDMSSPSSPIVHPLKSTNSVPVEEKPNPFSSAITEPHRLTSEFGERLGSTQNGVSRNKPRRRVWLQLLLLTLLGGAGLTVLLESTGTDAAAPAQPTRSAKATEVSMRAESLSDMSQAQGE
ncbi:MAG: serine/threonine-protein kinase, partial [Bradymonadia bacterium]